MWKFLGQGSNPRHRSDNAGSFIARPPWNSCNDPLLNESGEGQGMRLARWVSRAVGRGRWLGKPAQTHLEVPWVELGGLGWVNRCREGSYGASKRDCEGDREPSREPGGQGLVGGRWMKNQMGFFFFFGFCDRAAPVAYGPSQARR